MEEIMLNVGYTSKYTKLDKLKTIILLSLGLYVALFWSMLFFIVIGIIPASAYPIALSPLWTPILGMIIISVLRKISSP